MRIYIYIYIYKRLRPRAPEFAQEVPGTRPRAHRERRARAPSKTSPADVNIG